MDKNVPIPVDTVLTVNQTGHTVNAWGKGMFFLPHMITVDSKNNIWLTDVALHQVFKFAPYGGNQHHRYPNQMQARYQANVNLSGDGIRESRAFQRQPLSRDGTFSSFGKDFSGYSGKPINRSRTAHNNHQAQPVNFDDISLNRGAGNLSRINTSAIN